MRQSSLTGDTLRISRTAGSITIDGDLSDEGWRNAIKVEKFYEISPGDNVEPKTKTIGYLTYDDRFFYVGLDLHDPEPPSIRAPYGDRDSLNWSSDDFAGIFVDSMNTGRTATEFLVSARNVQYDAMTDDGSGENSSPDLFWDSATKLTNHGWTVEMRIPFASLRYTNRDLQTWGIALFRNYPRGFRYQIFSAPIPRGSNCMVCRLNKLQGLEHLPSAGHVIAAPYVSARHDARPENGALGARLVGENPKPQVGLDVKYIPDANNTIDLTVRPDFSQIESDAAQISANERFAVFYPEKRPFFLEGVDLFQTPIQAVHTRTITSPTWGGRVTGQTAGIRYTALISDDQGRGSVIIPGGNGSSFASRDFGSMVFLARVKRDIGSSFMGALVTQRHNDDGQGHNRVIGPDFQWRPSPGDVVSGQLLFSESRTPNRRDEADEWDGRGLRGYASKVTWNHNTRHLDWFGEYTDASAGFRGDAGFVPQVDYRRYSGGGGWQEYPKGIVSRQRTFINVDHTVDRSGTLVSRDVFAGIGMDTRYNGFLQFRYHDGRFRAGHNEVGRRQFGYVVQLSPSRVLSYVGINGNLGQDVDFANARPARGSTFNASASLHPTKHLEVALLRNARSLSIDDAVGVRRHLFTQHVSRARATYAFTSRMFARVTTQYVLTTRNPSLYLAAVSRNSGAFSSSVLLAYKLNWQSVAFVGYGDDRELSPVDRLEKKDRQVFVKFSYAYQH